MQLGGGCFRGVARWVPSTPGRRDAGALRRAAGVAAVFVVSQRLITILWLGVLFVLSQSYLTLAATRVAMQTERSRG